MTSARPVPQARRPRRRTIATALAVAAGAALPTLLPSAATAEPLPAARPAAARPALAGDQRLKGDDGRRSFGVQPSGPKAVDPRPNLTYQNVKPGQRLFDHVAVINISTRPVTLSVYASDAYNTTEGAFDVLRQNEKSKDLGAWVKLRRDKVTVPARSAFITPIEVAVPKNAEPGDHAAAIVASLQSTVRDAKGNVVNLDERVGTRLYVRVAGELHPKVELDRHDASFHSATNRVTPGRADVTYTIKNTGNVRLAGKQTIRVTNLIGGSSVAGDVPELPELLPGNEFSFTRPVEDVLPTFLNTAYVTIDPQSITGNVDPAMAQVTGSERFWAMSWPAALVLALLAGTGLRYWWRRRRRRQAEAGPTAWGDGGSKPRPGPGPGDGGGEPTASPGGEPAGERRPAAGITPRIALAVLVAGLAGALAVLAPASPAGAASSADGTLTFVPGSGTAGTPIYTVTSGPCPEEATNVVGYLFGSGMPKTGKIVIPNQDPPIRHDGSFGVGLQDNLLNFAREEGATLHGAYRLSLRCVDQFLLKTYAEFNGTITFPDPTRFEAPVPTKPPVDGVPWGYLGLVFPEYRKAVEDQARLEAADQAAQRATPTASAGAAAGPPTGVDAAATTAAEDGAGFDPSAVWPFFAALAGVAVLGGLGAWWTRRPSPVRPGGSGQAVEWPDEEPGHRNRIRSKHDA